MIVKPAHERWGLLGLPGKAGASEVSAKPPQNNAQEHAFLSEQGLASEMVTTQCKVLE